MLLSGRRELVPETNGNHPPAARAGSGRAASPAGHDMGVAAQALPGADLKPRPEVLDLCHGRFTGARSIDGAAPPATHVRGRHAEIRLVDAEQTSQHQRREADLAAADAPALATIGACWRPARRKRRPRRLRVGARAPARPCRHARASGTGRRRRPAGRGFMRHPPAPRCGRTLVSSGIEVERMRAAFAADAGDAGPAERRAQVAQEPQFTQARPTRIAGATVRCAVHAARPDRGGRARSRNRSRVDRFPPRCRTAHVAPGRRSPRACSARRQADRGEDGRLDPEAAVACIAKRGTPPPVTTVAPSSRATRSKASTFSRCSAEISRPIDDAASRPTEYERPRPAGERLDASARPDRPFDEHPLEHRQTPVFRKLARTRPSTALSKSQSANTMPAFLPPSSNEIGFTPSAAAFMMALPVRVSPVKVIAAMSGCVVMNRPPSPAEAVHEVEHPPWARRPNASPRRAASPCPASPPTASRPPRCRRQAPAPPRSAAAAAGSTEMTPTTPSGLRTV